MAAREAEEARLTELLLLGADGSGPRARAMQAREERGPVITRREDEIASVEAAEARVKRLRELDTPRREARELQAEQTMEDEGRQAADIYMEELMNEISEEAPITHSAASSQCASAVLTVQVRFYTQQIGLIAVCPSNP